MRKVVIGGLLLSAAMLAGCTTTRGDVRAARQDLREAQAYGSLEDVRDARRDLRRTRRDYRRDNRPY